MDSRTYPGQGLSLPQLAFALKQEVRRAAYFPSYSFDKLSQLDQDFTTILATIREWRNSLVPINRLPEDILSLIPTYLFHQSDRLRASFVCLHWRRIFLRRAELWSELFIWKGEDYTKTLLERSKNSILDVSIRGGVPASTITLLSPHIKRIGRLQIVCSTWMDIQKFSEIDSGPLPFLHTLDIHGPEESDLEDFNAMTPPSLPHFSNATYLKSFHFYSETNLTQFINHFIFPNIVSLEFSIKPSEGFHASQLLDFLEASPMLRTIELCIAVDISLGDVLQNRVVVLPNVESFDLIMAGGSGYELVAHISCPSARYTSLAQEDDDPEQAFCIADSWDAIVHQYTRSPAEEVTLEMRRSAHMITCELIFRSPDTTVIELDYFFDLDDTDEDAIRVLKDVFARATLVIQNHPQLTSVKRFNICHSFHLLIPTSIPHIANEARRLFQALAPLDELTIYHCDIPPYFHSFIDIPQGDITEPVVFPPVKQLTISHPVRSFDGQCMAAIIGLAELQHARGIPFERVIVCRDNMLAGMEEGLRPWVGSVEFRDGPLHGQSLRI